MPDYNLYDEWVQQQINKGRKRKEFEYYLDYSIGFTTRGCFRKCDFCVNKNYNKVQIHSPIEEFLSPSRKKICLLDDNILGYKDWKNVIEKVKSVNKPFQYKQGMDIRTMTEEKSDLLASCRYDGDFIFAFDNIEEEDVIINKIKLWRKQCTKRTKLYVLCGFDRNDKYDDEFWVQDIVDTFKRIYLLSKYDCYPYIMRYKEYENSPYRGIYINLASWCNQPHLFKNMTFEEFSVKKGISDKVYKQYKDDPIAYLADNNKKGASWKYIDEFKIKHPKLAEQYFHLKFNES